jgi:hypothetical protein
MMSSHSFCIFDAEIVWSASLALCQEPFYVESDPKVQCRCIAQLEGLFQMNEKGRTYLKNAIWKNPVGWSAKIAGSRLRSSLLILFHICLSVSLFFIYWLLAPICHQHPSVLIGPAIILFGVGVAYPAMYVYAIYRLLKFVKNKENV